MVVARRRQDHARICEKEHSEEYRKLNRNNPGENKGNPAGLYSIPVFVFGSHGGGFITVFIIHGKALLRDHLSMLTTLSNTSVKTINSNFNSDSNIVLINFYIIFNFVIKR